MAIRIGASAEVPQKKTVTVAPQVKSRVATDYHRDSYTAGPTAGPAPVPKATFSPVDWIMGWIQKGKINPNGRAVGASSGAEAAARLKKDSNYAGDPKAGRAYDLRETVKAHQDDPAFLAQLYQNLEPKLAAQLVANATRGATVAEVDGLAKSLGAAARTGTLPAGYLKQFGAAAASDLSTAEPMSIVLHSSAGTGLDAARRGFLGGAMDSNHAIGSGADAARWARVAGQVMAGDPSGALVKDYLAALPSDSRETFLKNGLSLVPHSGETGLEELPFSGMEEVVGLSAKMTGEGFADFRTQVFKVASNALPALGPSDPGLVDGLKTLYLSDAKQITEQLFFENGNAGFDPDGRALANFLQAGLFTHPDANDPLVKMIGSEVSDLRSKIFDTQAPEGQRVYAGKVLGDLLGSLQVGYLRGVQENGKDQQANQSLIGALVDHLPVPGGEVTGAAARAVTKDLLDTLANGNLQADLASMTRLRAGLLKSVLLGVRSSDAQSPTGANVEDAVKAEMTSVINANTQLTLT